MPFLEVKTPQGHKRLELGLVAGQLFLGLTRGQRPFPGQHGGVEVGGGGADALTEAQEQKQLLVFVVERGEPFFERAGEPQVAIDLEELIAAQARRNGGPGGGNGARAHGYIIAMANLKLHVVGMHCGNCQNKVERALKGVPGVYTAIVDWSGGEAEVDFDDDMTTPAQLVSAVQQAGYTATVV